MEQIFAGCCFGAVALPLTNVLAIQNNIKKHEKI